MALPVGFDWTTGRWMPGWLPAAQRPQWLAIEIKQKDGKLKPKQKELHELVEYHHGKIHVIRTLKQAMELIGVVYAD